MKPIFRGEIDLAPGRLPRAELTESIHGRLWIWKHPEPDRRYCGAFDVAEGLGGDFTEGGIETAGSAESELVAYWYSNTTPLVQASVAAYALGRYYNWALMGIERNAIGMAMIAVLLEGHADYPQMHEYPRLYHHRLKDKLTGEYMDRVGFLTNDATKKLAISRFQEALAKRRINIYHQRIIKQLQGFGIDPAKSGRMRYTQKTMDPMDKKYHDDAVMMMLINEEMRNECLIESSGPSTAVAF